MYIHSNKYACYLYFVVFQIFFLRIFGDYNLPLAICEYIYTSNTCIGYVLLLLDREWYFSCMLFSHLRICTCSYVCTYAHIQFITQWSHTSKSFVAWYIWYHWPQHCYLLISPRTISRYHPRKKSKKCIINDKGSFNRWSYCLLFTKEALIGKVFWVIISRLAISQVHSYDILVINTHPLILQ